MRCNSLVVGVAIFGQGIILGHKAYSGMKILPHRGNFVRELEKRRMGTQCFTFSKFSSNLVFPKSLQNVPTLVFRQKRADVCISATRATITQNRRFILRQIVFLKAVESFCQFA